MSGCCCLRKKIIETEIKQDTTFDLKDVLKFAFTQSGTVPVTIGSYNRLVSNDVDAPDQYGECGSDGYVFEPGQITVRFDDTAGAKRVLLYVVKLVKADNTADTSCFLCHKK